MKRRNIENSSRETHHIHLRGQRDIKKTTKMYFRKDVKIDFFLKKEYNAIINRYQKEVDKLEQYLIESKQNQENLESIIREKQRKIGILSETKIEIEKYTNKAEKSYCDKVKKYDLIKTEIVQLEEYNNSIIKEYEFMKAKIGNLNKKIMTKENNQKDLLLQLKDITHEHNQIKTKIEILEKQIELNRKDYKEEINGIQRELKTYEKDILTKRHEKKKFLEGLSRYKLKTPQEIIAEESHQTQLQKEIKVVEKTILANEEWLSHLKERNKLFLGIKEDLNCKKEKLAKLNEALKLKLNQIDKKLADEKEYFFEKYRKFERIESEVESYGFLQRSIFNAFNRNEFEEYKSLKNNRIYLNQFCMALSKLIKHYDDELSNNSNTIVESAIKTIEHEIQMTDNCIKSHQEKKKEILTRERSLMKDPPVNRRDGHDISKDDELAPLRAQLEGIKKYVKNKHVKELQKNLDYLENYHKELKDSEAKIEKIEEANRVAKQNIARCQFEYKLSLEQKKAIIQNYQIDSDKSFQTDENADLYKGQTLESMQKNLDRIIDSIHDLDDKYKKSNEKIILLRKCSNEISSELEKMAINYINDKFDNDYNDKLNQYIRKMERVKEHLDRLAIEITKTKNEKDRLELCKLIIDAHIDNYQSEKIKSYQENYQLKLASLHIAELELQKTMNSEMKKIESHFETCLQNLQETCNKKRSELESKQEAFKKSKEQETERRQELQKQLEALNSQADTIHQQSETVAHELKGLHKEAKESSKTLATVEQKKSQLETKIEQFKKELDEEEEQLKHAESE